MNPRHFLFVGLATVASLLRGEEKPKHINLAIELLDQKQPVYYSYGADGYEAGKAAAKTWADLLLYDMEGNSMDFTALRAFMKGLVDAGPTPSGHRTPAVIVTLPLYGLNEEEVLANHWMIQQALACGVHGLHFCHARNPEAIAAFVRCARYEINRQAVGAGLKEGIRMFGTHQFAAWVWGVTPKEYYDRADPWPLNPKGELLLGVKIEDHVALEQSEASVRVPGIAFAEWGPRDTSYANGFFEAAMDYGRKPDFVEPPPLRAAAERVIKASKAAHVFILDNVRPENVTRQIDNGIMICAGGIPEAAEAGRAYTKRTLPWNKPAPGAGQELRK
jgi:4-hydroxy-2-oxoheptanedioate aldolase